MTELYDILRENDLDRWMRFLKDCTMQEAYAAQVAAQGVGKKDFCTLAFKRGEHLNGEHRHPELWS